MLNDVAIDNVSHCKYLGHCINDKLIDADDMARQRKQSRLCPRRCIGTNFSEMSLFKSYCSSLYTSALCFNYSSESLRKLCVAYNFFVIEKLPFCQETTVPGLAFATRDLSTCRT